MSESTMGPRNQGAPDYTQHLHPSMADNYGKWDYHERIKPGLLRYVAENGNSLYVVRAGSPRTMSPALLRRICDIADRFCDGFLRFTIRCNLEFSTEKKENVEPLIKAVKEELGFPIGATGPSVSNILHTQGWLHCNLPASDAAGAVKALMDDLIYEFENEEMPNRVHLSTSCCQINCGSHADISIIVQHHHGPRIDHDKMQICELPKVVAICPAAAIRPIVMNGKSSLEVV
ncbi:MAG: dissimilatory-type sulfite reductase subunit beta, partial [Gammaproteobacteria bacterium]|nr:dissimilatory-type sulfite reductase subunit beta [Gammaproteobacteria bacterium]